MVIKYRCWDKEKKAFRKPDPDNMVSIFTPGTRNAMRIVADSRYEFLLWTSAEDKNGNDVYPGDIFDHKYYVNWDILNGRWGIYERGTEKFLYTFKEFRPHQHEVTSTIFEENGTESIS